jgi:shikimate dehydrogenase
MGWPIGHSLSPTMHRAAARALKIDLAYGVFEVHPDDLGAAVAGIRALGMHGANVTVPHKVRVTGFVDSLSGEARAIGAANCIASRDRVLVGHNTDAAGFINSLEAALPDWRPEHSLILGTGGSARAAAFALKSRGTEVSVWGRREDQARGLAAEMLAGAGLSIATVGGDALEAAAARADLVVNCTSLGMLGGPEDRLPVDPRGLAKGCVVYDLVYNPLLTPFLAEAEGAGLKAIGGLRMLAEQAALSFALWTGRKPDPEVMEKAALCALQSHDQA